MERAIQFSMRERELTALLAVLDVWSVLVGAFNSQTVLDKFLEEAGRAQGWPNNQVIAAKQIVRDRMRLLMRAESFEDSPLAWIERMHKELATKLKEEA